MGGDSRGGTEARRGGGGREIKNEELRMKNGGQAFAEVQRRGGRGGQVRIIVNKSSGRRKRPKTAKIGFKTAFFANYGLKSAIFRDYEGFLGQNAPNNGQNSENRGFFSCI